LTLGFVSGLCSFQYAVNQKVSKHGSLNFYAVHHV